MQLKLVYFLVCMSVIVLAANGKQFMLKDLSLMQQFASLNEQQEAAYQRLIQQTNLLEKERKQQELQRQKLQEKEARIFRKYLGRSAQRTSILRDFIHRY